MKDKFIYFLVGTVIVIIGALILNGTRLSKINIDQDASDKTIRRNPKLVAFMREGDLWKKDYPTGEETKLSKASKVSNPRFSPDGKHIVYSEIIYATGGFPTYALYIIDVEGEYEHLFSLSGNDFASKLIWSKDGKLLGITLFAIDLLGSSDYYEKVFIYDVSTRQEIPVGMLNKRETFNSDRYTLSDNTACTKLKQSYQDFCAEYISYISLEREWIDTRRYKREEFINSEYTKPGYKLYRSEKLDNGLVILEYYTGDPQNPESKWQKGSGSGLFYPGYDKGVTETYTLLVNEDIGEIIDEISQAVNSDFYFLK